MNKLNHYKSKFFFFFIIILPFFNFYSAKGSDLMEHQGARQLKTILLANDGILTMSPSGSYPIVAFKDRTYFGYYTSKNTIDLRFYDNKKRYISNPVILWNNWGYNSAGNMLGDDHANPSIIILKNQHGENETNNGKLLVAAAEHRGRLQVKRSKYIQHIDEWDPPVVIRKSLATYPRLLEMANGRIYLFCRLSRFAPNSRATFYFWTSDDGGQNWSNPNLLTDTKDGTDDAIYISVAAGHKDNTIHIALNRIDYDNPSKGVWRYRDLYYLKMDTLSNTCFKADGKSLGKPPFELNDADLVFKSESTIGKEDWTYISDIKDYIDGPRIISINEVGRASLAEHPSKSKKVINIHFFSNGEWKTESISETTSFHYVNMASIYPDDEKKVLGFIGAEYGNGSFPCVFVRKKKGWELSKILKVPKLGLHHARPFLVDPGKVGLFAIWCEIEDYHGSPYTDWKSRIIGLIRY